MACGRVLRRGTLPQIAGNLYLNQSTKDYRPTFGKTTILYRACLKSTMLCQ